MTLWSLENINSNTNTTTTMNNNNHHHHHQPHNKGTIRERKIS